RISSSRRRLRAKRATGTRPGPMYVPTCCCADNRRERVGRPNLPCRRTLTGELGPGLVLRRPFTSSQRRDDVVEVARACSSPPPAASHDQNQVEGARARSTRCRACWPERALRRRLPCRSLRCVDDLARCVLQVGKMPGRELLDRERRLYPEDVHCAVN